MTDQFFSMLEFVCKFEDLENKGGGEKILANCTFLLLLLFPKIPSLHVDIVYPIRDCKAVMSIHSSSA